MKNSFLALREMEMAEFRENRQDAVRENVRKQLHSAEFISNVLELFFPKMAVTLGARPGRALPYMPTPSGCPGPN